MAHSCRWRFPARPGGSSNSGAGRKAGRVRVSASLRSGAGPDRNADGLEPGFDAALRVSAAIGGNLQKFRDVLGESSGSSSGEEDAFAGFAMVTENGRIQSPERTSTATSSQEKKPRGRPPKSSTPQKFAPTMELQPLSVITGQPTERTKRPPGRPPGSGEKRRGRPPASASHRSLLQLGQVLFSDGMDAGQEHSSSPACHQDMFEDGRDKKATKRTFFSSVQRETLTKFHKLSRGSKLTKLKRLQDVKLKPLKSGLLKGVPVPVVPRRRRGRPPSAERLKAETVAASLALESPPIDAGTAKHKALKERDLDTRMTQHSKLRASHPADECTSPGSPLTVDPVTPLKIGRPLNLRQSPRHIKLSIAPPSKRTDTTIAKQLLQRAKKGAQKKKLLEKEAGGVRGSADTETGIRRNRRTQLKNIRQFIMPVVSTVSLRIIKTPKRFIEDEANFGSPPPNTKIARLESAVPAPASQPSTTPSALVSTSPSTTSTATISATGPTIETFTSPPPPAPTGSATVVGGSNHLSNNSCNNSNGRFSSSAASCGSSAVSQHSSQLSSGESSRSSSPSIDDSSCDSQISEGTQELSEEPYHSPSSHGEREASLHHSPRPLSPPSDPETEHMELLEPNRQGRRGHGLRRGNLLSRGRSSLISNRKRAIISPATGVLMSPSQAGSHHASSTASSSSSPPPPPLLTPPQPLQSASSNVPAISDHSHSAWIMPHPFLPTPPILPGSHDKRRAILREPTFRWTSSSRAEQQYFSSAKYAKAGLIRKPIFDNFRPPPLTPEDVGLMPPGPGGGGVAPGGFPASGGVPGVGTRLFSPLHHHHQQPSSRFESPLQKRSPLLRAPRFTPSAAHSRIYESVTLPSSSGSSPGSQSPLQATSPSNRALPRKKRRSFGHSRGQPRSPSHSMTTRSSQLGSQAGKSSDISSLTSSVPTSVTGNSSPLPGVAVSPIASSALTQAPFNSFSSGHLGPINHKASDARRVDGCLGGGGSSASSSSQLFPHFASSPQGTSGGMYKVGRERTISSRELTKGKEREPERNRERDKEGKREAKKDWERRGRSLTPEGGSIFAMDGKDVEESSTQKKNAGQKKSDSSAGVEASAVETSMVQLSSKVRLPKKGRLSEKGVEVEGAEKVKDKERSDAPTQPKHSGNSPTTASLSYVLAHAEKQPATDRRVAGLLEKAKAQLYKIEKSKSAKSVDQPKVQEGDSPETPVRGPRIKHVCRRAAVALGNRATFPDDMPTLSALPWKERKEILSSMGNDDKSSVAGSEEAEPSSPPIKPVTRQKMVQEATPKKGRRSRRCGQCPGCQVPDDCGICANCLDKPKFGGRNIKKQCCKVRKCQNLQWMPSKMFLQKQAKGKKDKKRNRLSEKREGHHSVKPQCPEVSLKPAPPSCKDDPLMKKSESPPPAPEEEKQKHRPPSSPSPSSSLESEPPPPPIPEDSRPSIASPNSASRKDRKQQQQSNPLARSPLAASSSQPIASQASEKKEGASKSPSTEPKNKVQQPAQPSSECCLAPETKQIKKHAARCVSSPKQKPKEKEKQTVTKPDRSTLSFLNTPSMGGAAKLKAPCDGVHRIRVDFQEDRDVEKVWEMGGLSILTSVPITPRVVCFLCASSGNVEFVFCQVCCEPFHVFCLGEMERPLNEEWENWCCRRCRFCHACGRQHQKTKQLLECDKCRNSFHPECLAPNHPTRPTKKRIWICTKCVRCKSCGATKPGKSWDAQWSHDFAFCHDCAKLFSKGNICPLCDKSYDVNDHETKMMQCEKCNSWVHAKCESLTDEMYELLSSSSGSQTYTCINCTERHPAKWHSTLQRQIQSSMQQVLTALLNSHTSTHLLRYRQAVTKPPELNPVTEESLPSHRSPEGPDPPVLTEICQPSDSPSDLESVEKKMNSSHYKSVMEFSDDIVRIIQTAINSEGGQLESRKVNSMVKSFFIRQMDRFFPWLKVKESNFWEKHKASYNNALLPNAVLPPSLDHNYALWQETDGLPCAEQPFLTKIIPAPSSKVPGEPDPPVVTTPTLPSLPPLKLINDLSQEDSPEAPPPPDGGDNRQCVLCLNYGDENTNLCGRLLYIGQNEWAHVNCALWSAEVFEDDDGSLKNVHTAVSRGKQLPCENCQRPGATVSCCFTSCLSTYHFMCARQCHCVFLEDKKVYCQRHREFIKGEAVSDKGFEVTRRILVDFEGINLKRKFLHGLEPDNVHLMIGSMTIESLGMLTELSDCERKLFPVGYQCSRVYWSTLDARKRCVYTCRILTCRSLVADSANTKALSQENNYTITHSPPTVPGAMRPSPCPDTVSVDHILPVKPKPRVYFRNRHPSYPPCHHSLSARPTPSPGSSLANAKVTNEDSHMGSDQQNTGSRRHSTSSLLHQPSVVTSVSMSQKAGLIDPLTDHSQNHETPVRIGAVFGVNDRTDSREGPCGAVSPLLGTAVLTSHQKGNGGIRTEKAKQTLKATDLPAGVTLLPITLKERVSPVASLEPKAIGKTGSPQHLYHKTIKKSHDSVSGVSPEAAVKSPWSSGGLTAMEETSKVKLKLGKDISKVSKEMSQVLNSSSKGGNIKTQGQDTLSRNNPTIMSSDKLLGPVEGPKSDSPRFERQFKSKERFTSEKKPSSTMEGTLPMTGSEQGSKATHDNSSEEKNCTERLSLPSSKIDPNGTKLDTTMSTSLSQESHGLPRKSSHAVLFSHFASPESDSHTHPGDCEESLLVHHCTEDDGDADDHHLEDKHHEEDSDGSAKRRYPRRSARARSNMFYGLTPFYGVRSYGEEDLRFYAAGEIPLRKRSGSSKRSAEGQVDGADDISTSSSSADSGEDDEGGFNPQKDPYYYNFTRTIINPRSTLPDIEGIGQCLGRGTQLCQILRDEGNETDAENDEILAATKSLECQQIGQLDGVDDDSESDTSMSTSSTTTATTSTTHKNSTKKRGRDRAEKVNTDLGKEAENSTGNGSAQTREARKGQKDNCLPGSVKSQNQDPLETQLSLSADLLKSDSDNNNSDDCNILPSDIMEFVLNTPSMHSLGQQPETTPNEPFSLDEGYGVDQRKDILFEDFTPPLTSSESVETGVNTPITVEEPYGLPLELPSDLSVLTTRSPSVNNQNHGSLMSDSSERDIMSLAAEEAGVDKTEDAQRAGSTVSGDDQQDGTGDSQVAEGDLTPKHFIGDHISSPGITQVLEAGGQDRGRKSVTPGLASSPTLAPQGQKFIPTATVSTGPSQITSSAMQSATSQLKPGPEKLIVLNQHLQPLYVLQTLPNGVTQKIHITPSVSPTGIMNTSGSVLTGISTGISTPQTIFPAGPKGLVPMPHPQLHAFSSTSQTSFPSVIPSTTSGLFIRVPSHDHQIIASEAGHRPDLVSSASSIPTSPAMLSTGHGKKRPISRIQPQKAKKLLRSKSQPTLAPSDVGPSVTLINSPQITAGIPAQAGLVELGTSHRKMPNIIKRSKSGVMYIDSALLPQTMPISTTNQPGIIGHDSHILPCTVSGLNPNQSVLNVVSMPPTAPGNLLGANSVSLSTPGLISSDITGPISNIVFKTPHNLGLSDQQMILQHTPPMMSQITSSTQTSIANSICVLPPNQFTVSANQQVEKEGTLHIQHPATKVVPDKILDSSNSGHLSIVPSPIVPDLNRVGFPFQRSQTSQLSLAMSQKHVKSSDRVSRAIVKGKQKAKRALSGVLNTSVKKIKAKQVDTGTEAHGDRSSLQVTKEHTPLEQMDTGRPSDRGPKQSDSALLCESIALKQKPREFHDPNPKIPDLSGQNIRATSTLLPDTPDPKDSEQDSLLEYKPKKGLLFEICSDDGFKICSESFEEAWKSLTDKVQEARSNAKLKELSFDGANGLRMLGIVHDAVVFLLEQLYGTRYCKNYRFRFHKPEEVDEPPVNPHGSARAEVYHRRSVLDMFNFLASKHRQAPEFNPQEDEEEETQSKSARRASGTDLSLADRLGQLRKSSKESVGVYRSAIHGRGLFCKKNLEAGEMVIEYSGNVIRSALTDKREKYYDGKGIGCYMFRIDEYEVVDATMHGNPARFINHSCEPNCNSRVISTDGQKHIVIFAMRRIYRGEELTYDYKFPIEEPGNKLPCNCGAKKCRKFLN